MVANKYINGQRYILTEVNNNETKKQAFNTDIHDGINKLMGICTSEEKLLMASSIDDDIKKQQIKKIRAFQRKLFKLYTFQI